jgi:hypothetical protein
MAITPTNPFKGRQTRADILWTLWEEFDILDVEETISDSVYRWASDSFGTATSRS